MNRSLNQAEYHHTRILPGGAIRKRLAAGEGMLNVAKSLPAGGAAISLPCSDFLNQRLLVGDTPIEALA
jgi:hypothetical protein